MTLAEDVTDMESGRATPSDGALTGPRCLAILTDPFNPAYPSGFAGRYFKFLNALSERFEVETIGLDMEPPVSEENPSFSVPLPGEATVIQVPPNALLQRGLGARFRKALHLLSPGLPAISFIKAGALPTTSWNNQDGLVVLFRIWTSHLAFSMPPSRPIVALLEEEHTLCNHQGGQTWRERVWNASERVRIRNLYRKLNKRVDKIVAISDDEAETFGLYIDSIKLHVLPRGIDTSYFTPREEPQDVDIAIFGRFEDSARSESALRFYDALISLSRNHDPPLKWLFVGKDPLPELLDLASESVEVTGFVEDVRPFYGRSKIIVVPSAGGSGVKTTALQAWAMGKPTALTAFAAKGLPAKDGVNAVVRATHEQLAEATLKLLRDDALRSALGHAARMTCERELNVDVIAERFAHLCLTTYEQRKPNSG